MGGVAGGMTAGRGRTLAERSARAGIGTGTGHEYDAGLPAAEPAQVRPRAQHCWVVDPPQSPGRWPGLLTEWRREPSGAWSGRVAWAVDGGAPDLDTVLLQAWLPAHHLRGPDG